MSQSLPKAHSTGGWLAGLTRVWNVIVDERGDSCHDIFFKSPIVGWRSLERFLNNLSLISGRTRKLTIPKRSKETATHLLTDEKNVQPL